MTPQRTLLRFCCFGNFRDGSFNNIQKIPWMTVNWPSDIRPNRIQLYESHITLVEGFSLFFMLIYSDLPDRSILYSVTELDVKKSVVKLKRISGPEQFEKGKIRLITDYSPMLVVMEDNSVWCYYQYLGGSALKRFTLVEHITDRIENLFYCDKNVFVITNTQKLYVNIDDSVVEVTEPSDFVQQICNIKSVASENASKCTIILLSTAIH
jgi:hypothetical protein